MTLADRIDKRLKEIGLSRRAASEKAELSETYIRDLIEGRSKSPRIEGLEKLAAALQTNVEWLRTGNGDPNAFVDPNLAEVTSIMPRLDERRRRELAQYAHFLEMQAKREGQE